MSPRNTCPFELVLKIIPFKVKHIYLITLLLPAQKVLLKTKEVEKKKRAFRFLKVAAGNRRKNSK